MSQQSKKAVTLRDGYWFFFEEEGNKIAANGNKYKVEFKVTSMLKGELECSLFKDNELLATETKAYFQKDSKTILFTSLASGFLTGLIIVFVYLTLIE